MSRFRPEPPDPATGTLRGRFWDTMHMTLESHAAAIAMAARRCAKANPDKDAKDNMKKIASALSRAVLRGDRKRMELLVRPAAIEVSKCWKKIVVGRISGLGASVAFPAPVVQVKSVACNPEHLLSVAARSCADILSRTGIDPSTCYGCGQEGCVFASRSPGRVVKLSVSLPEIKLSEFIRRMKHRIPPTFPKIYNLWEITSACTTGARNKPVGIGKALKGAKTYDGPIYVIEREDVAPFEVVKNADKFNFAMARLEFTAKQILSGEKPFEGAFDPKGFGIANLVMSKVDPADREYAEQMLEAFRWALEHGIFMRDMTIENLGQRKIGRDRYHVVIRDFGINITPGERHPVATIQGL